ncbi:Branched-chain amino acid transport protein AzlD [Modicisalibacter ilicicola DSM 19980]|uniref:Branched-chain amino acid transport protein AzlD n=1 Tax=Modicisalibacter ilicicola DSM 19980 TaxID=1121942 RepID=A0A1M4XJM7_9GAMM|nr:AzlD domain-containing protein [Halomonas ilicicola]SHE93586.1 Branched-chain amino acid transport protein AzlD [Halomonas ilicicola DSM 19980]
MNDSTLALMIVISALATFATRVLPFIALSRHAEHPLILHLGRYLPPAVMMILVIYALRDFRPVLEGQLNLAANGLPTLIASLVVASLHLWRRNALVSIIGGTGLYMVMVQLGWHTTP